MSIIDDIMNTPSPERDRLDCAFLRAHAHYLDTAESKWPFVNGARVIGETSRRVANRMEAKDAEIERLRLWIRRIDNINDEPGHFSQAIDRACADAFAGKPMTGRINVVEPGGNEQSSGKEG